MDIAAFAISLFGAVFLLLFAVGFVRAGVERHFGARFMHTLGGRQSGAGSAMTGLGLAVALQSSTAVALLVCGFATGGHLPFSIGFAALLGADLGSALVVQILALDLRLIEPVLLLTGGWLYLKSKRQRNRTFGQIILGLGLILVSLHLMREAVQPLQDSRFLTFVAGYLDADPLTGFLIGAGLAFLMHSSVAAILICVAMVAGGALTLAAGIAVVLGANFGGPLIAVWLTRDNPPAARRIPLANACLRGGLALVALLALALSGQNVAVTALAPETALVLAHVAFNAAVLILFLPLAGVTEKLFSRLLPGTGTGAMTHSALDVSLATSTRNGTGQAPDSAVTVSAVRQDILKMLDEVERMYRPVMELFQNHSPEQASAIRNHDAHVNTLFSGLRRYVSENARSDLPKGPLKETRMLLDYAIRVEAAGDIVAKRMTVLSEELHASGAGFSKAGIEELNRLHSLVLAGFALARHVLLVEDTEAARRLVLDKAEVKRQERNSRTAHLKRLERGKQASLASSDEHLQLLRAMRELFGHIAAVAYPILYRNGQVLETRLVDDAAGADT